MFDLGIAIPVFNAESTLRETLESIRLACYNDSVQIVISDNHSTDNSMGIIREFLDSLAKEVASHVFLVRPEQHLDKRGAHWTFVMQQLEAKWLLMLHSDDVLIPDSVSLLITEARNAGNSVALIGGRARIFSNDLLLGDAPVRPRWQPRALVPGNIYARLLRWHCSLYPFTAIRKEVFRDLGGFDNHFELLQDWSLWLAASRRGSILLLPEVVGGWRQHPTSAAYSDIFRQETERFAKVEFGAGDSRIIRAIAHSFAENRFTTRSHGLVLLVRISFSLISYGIRARYRTGKGVLV